ncbi:MAG: helix-turn-helix domain-containing protein, partial [Terriglobia bacterium]
MESAEGKSVRTIAQELGISLVPVVLWRRRFKQGGVEALRAIKEGRGPRRTITDRKIRQILDAPRQEPPKGQKRWSVRSLARACGLSQTMVQRIWDEHGLRPHLAGRASSVKLRDVVGVYVNPPDKVLALALDRAPRQGRHRSPGMARLVRALKELASRVVGDSRWRPHQEDFLVFLRRVERALPGEQPIHLIVGRQGTHTQPRIREWLKHRRRFQLHPTPADSTWLNWAALWLGELSRTSVSRFDGVRAAEQAIRTYLADRPAQPCPFAWP